MTKAIMVIWLGVGQYATMATERFDTLDECVAAKAAISKAGFGSLSQKIPASSISCIPYEASE